MMNIGLHMAKMYTYIGKFFALFEWTVLMYCDLSMLHVIKSALLPWSF